MMPTPACIFCGLECEVTFNSHIARARVQCLSDKCGAAGPWRETQDEALAEWNYAYNDLQNGRELFRVAARGGGVLTMMMNTAPLTCHICGKAKGQPPERCPGHYCTGAARP